MLSVGFSFKIIDLYIYIYISKEALWVFVQVSCLLGGLDPPLVRIFVREDRVFFCQRLFFEATPRSGTQFEGPGTRVEVPLLPGTIPRFRGV